MSLTAARDTVRKFFTGAAPDSTQLTTDEIFNVMKRDPAQPDKNKAWLTNKLTHLKHYNLVAPVYSEGRPRRLVGVKLTQQGKQELERVGAGDTPPAQQASLPFISAQNVSLNTIAEEILRFEEQNPNIELDLNIKIKKELPVKQVSR